MKEKEFTEAKVDCPIYKQCGLSAYNCQLSSCPIVYWINTNEGLTQKKIEIQEDE